MTPNSSAIRKGSTTTNMARRFFPTRCGGYGESRRLATLSFVGRSTTEPQSNTSPPHAQSVIPIRFRISRSLANDCVVKRATAKEIHNARQIVLEAFQIPKKGGWTIRRSPNRNKIWKTRTTLGCLRTLRSRLLTSNNPRPLGTIRRPSHLFPFGTRNRSNLGDQPPAN